MVRALYTDLDGFTRSVLGPDGPEGPERFWSGGLSSEWVRLHPSLQSEDDMLWSIPVRVHGDGA
eukprot:2276709-Alexandrium_andersonii.AAC.1